MRKIQDVLEDVALVLFAVALLLMATAKAQADTRPAHPTPRSGVVEEDILLPPNMLLVQGIACEVEHPTETESKFIVRCHVRYADQTIWNGPACAMYDPVYEKSYWAADKKAHNENSTCERHLFEAVKKAKGQ